MTIDPHPGCAAESERALLSPLRWPMGGNASPRHRYSSRSSVAAMIWNQRLL
jgi:hypothetical protein